MSGLQPKNSGGGNAEFGEFVLTASKPRSGGRANAGASLRNEPAERNAAVGWQPNEPNPRDSTRAPARRSTWPFGLFQAHLNTSHHPLISSVSAGFFPTQAPEPLTNPS